MTHVKISYATNHAYIRCEHCNEIFDFNEEDEKNGRVTYGRIGNGRFVMAYFKCPLCKRNSITDIISAGTTEDRYIQLEQIVEKLESY